MPNLKHLTIFSAIALFAGIVAITVPADPLVAALGKFAIALSLVAFAAAATTYIMVQSFAAHVLRNEDFHWQ